MADLSDRMDALIAEIVPAKGVPVEEICKTGVAYGWDTHLEATVGTKGTVSVQFALGLALTLGCAGVGEDGETFMLCATDEHERFQFEAGDWHKVFAALAERHAIITEMDAIISAIPGQFELDLSRLVELAKRRGWTMTTTGDDTVGVLNRLAHGTAARSADGRSVVWGGNVGGGIHRVEVLPEEWQETAEALAVRLGRFCSITWGTEQP